MKAFRFLYALLLVVILQPAIAQPYGNEWIDYSKTHYSFRIWQDGLARIPYSTLQSSGIPVSELVGSHFKLYRQGKEEPVFVSNDNLFTSTDFIEFFARKADGKPDTIFYRDKSHQQHTYYNFFNDTVVYYLVADPNGGGLRYTDIANNLSGAPPKDNFFMHQSRVVYTARYNYGGPFNAFYDIVDSEYVPGEGPMDLSYIVGPSTVTKGIPTAKIYSGAAPNPEARVFYGYFNTNLSHDVLTTVGTKSFRDISFLRYSARKISIPLDLSDIVEGTTNVSIKPQIVGEWIGLNMIEIAYPRIFDFENATLFRFGLGKQSDTYLEVSNFNSGSTTTPVSYTHLTLPTKA
jgi:hypothetical protein